MFDPAKAKIGKKIPVEDDSIFEKCRSFKKSKKIYNLTPDKMVYTNGGVQLYILELYRSALESGIMKKSLDR